MNILDLFAGAGGLGLGFRKEKFSILLSSDVDEDCKTTYLHNWPNDNYLCGDIRKISISNLETFVGSKNVNIIVGGPPCKGFSTIGARASSNIKIRTRHDPRNYLFEKFIEVVFHFGPEVVLFENVSGLLSFKRGEILSQIKKRFKEIKYEVETFLLDAVDFKVPQVRKRVFIVARKRKKCIGSPCPSILDDLKPVFKNVNDAIADLAGMENKLENHVPLNHGDINIQRYKYIPEGGRLPEKELPKNLFRKNFGNTFKRLHRYKPSLTIVPGHNAFPIHPWLHRSLTVREAARIQTFPDNIVFLGSRQSQCLQVGNAVPVNLSVAWARHFASTL